MAPDEVVNRLERLLVEERGAIGELDAGRVATLAEEKESLLAALQRDWPSTSAATRQRLAALVGTMRHNCLLLAHARSCVRDALDGLTGPSTAYGRAGIVRAPAQWRNYLAE